MSPSSSSGFTSPLSLETAQLSNNPNGPPPLKPTELHYTITTSDGQSIRPEIIGKIDKGFFLAENDWTCYRRNYFQVTCSYTLNPSVPTGTTMLLNQSGSQVPIQHLAMSISAVVDGENGKKIDLVQHTPKRDKGPQLEIQRVVLLPRPVNTTLYNGGLGADGMRSDRLYDTNFAQAPNQPPTETTFERIQFKQATANNGKRRARQQYYHLIIELYADLGSSMGEGRWVKIARRVSAQMVVRGRSPGHYHVESRGANSSSGTGGASGQNGSMGSYGSPNGGMMDGRNGDSFVGGSNSMIGSGGYGGSYSTSRSSRYLASQGISIPPEPILTTEEEKAFTEAEGYRYYPHTLQDTSMSGMRAQLPPFQAHIDDRLPLNLGGYATSQPRLKQSYSNGYSLPSLTSPQLDAYNRNCGRFESVPSSRGYYPTAVVLSQINST